MEIIREIPLIDPNLTTAIVTFIICVIVGLVIGLFIEYYVRYYGAAIVFTLLGVLFGLMIGAVNGICTGTPNGEYQYEISVDENVLFWDVFDKYEVIERTENDTFIVKEKEEIDTDNNISSNEEKESVKKNEVNIKNDD